MTSIHSSMAIPSCSTWCAREARAPEHHDPAHRLRELHVARGAGGPGHRCSRTSTARAIPASATTAATSSSTRPRTLARDARVRSVRCRARQRPAALGRQCQQSPRTSPCSTRRQGDGHAPRSGRPPHPRLAGELQRPHVRLRRRTASTSRPKRSTTTRSATSRCASGRKLIIAGATAYSRTIDFDGLPFDRRRGRRVAAGRCRAHRRARRRRRAPVAGARSPTSSPSRRTRRCAARARLHPEPSSSTRRRIDKAVFPGLQGGPLMHVIAAKAVAFHEASQPSFRQYAADIVRNATALADALAADGLPHRLGRHRQPPDARRPAAVRRHGQGRPGGARRRGHHLQQERDPERPREAVRHERPAPRHRVRSPPQAWAPTR